VAWSEGLLPGSAAYEIAAANNPAIRVVAGPGTGKSFAMKRRVARLLEDGVDPSTILPVTFTRVAAEDLHRELVGMGVLGCEDLEGTTLHSLALRILMRRHVIEATGRTPRPLNEFEIKPLEADLQADHEGIRAVRKKMKAYEASWARLQVDEPGFEQTEADASFARDLISWLIFHESMLIGEVIPMLYQYLNLNPAARERAEYSHILVDEFQDLNKAEQGVIDMLSDRAEVCIVGDDDQSIYSFKYAHPEGIRDWLLQRPEADDLTLAECRRCPTRVVNMANALIHRNQNRPVIRALEPLGANGEGDVRILQYASVDDEVSGVARIVVGLVQEGVSAGDILILAQRSVIGTPIYEALVARGVPTRSYYAEAELDAEDAQRRFAILKLYVDREDRVALRWLLGLGSANWRAPGFRRLRLHCEGSGLSPWQALQQMRDGIFTLPHTSALVSRFGEIAGEVEQLEATANLRQAIDILFPDNAIGLRDLRALALSVLETIGEEDRTAFLSELTTAISKPEIPTEINDVRIMSLHKSKGLSAPVTIIAGCIEGLMPKQPDRDLPLAEQATLLEEQRRLFYVGITRVKASPTQGKVGTLILTCSQQMPLRTAMGAGIAPARTRYGNAYMIASRFIGELGPDAPRTVAG
jgi:superfamily I DNA/RNA helicase